MSYNISMRNLTTDLGRYRNWPQTRYFSDEKHYCLFIVASIKANREVINDKIVHNYIRACYMVICIHMCSGALIVQAHSNSTYAEMSVKNKSPSLYHPFSIFPNEIIHISIYLYSPDIQYVSESSNAHYSLLYSPLKRDWNGYFSAFKSTIINLTIANLQNSIIKSL